jgi:hypothetical protein
MDYFIKKIHIEIEQLKQQVMQMKKNNIEIKKKMHILEENDKIRNKILLEILNINYLNTLD